MRSLQSQISPIGLAVSLWPDAGKITALVFRHLSKGRNSGTSVWWTRTTADPWIYEHRLRLLGELDSLEFWESRRNSEKGTKDLLATMADGRIKLHVAFAGPALPAPNMKVSSRSATYLPVEVGGAHPEQVFAFLRRHGKQLAVVAVPRLLVGSDQSVPNLPLGIGILERDDVLSARNFLRPTIAKPFQRTKARLDKGQQRAILVVADVWLAIPCCSSGG